MRALIVEDDKIFALDLQDMLEGRGHEVIGPFDSVDDCMSIIQTTPPELALLDVALKNGESSAPVAAALREDGVHVFLITGKTSSDLREIKAFHGLPTLTKPITDEMLTNVLEGAELALRNSSKPD